jgi:hypothetical protein
MHRHRARAQTLQYPPPATRIAHVTQCLLAGGAGCNLKLLLPLPGLSLWWLRAGFQMHRCSWPLECCVHVWALLWCRPRLVLPRHATLKRLTPVVFDIYFGRYFGRGRTYPVELRRMPSNIILAEGFTLLYSSTNLLYPTNTLITDMGVVDKSVVQLYLIPQRGTDAPGPSWPLEEVVAVMSHAAQPTITTSALTRVDDSGT